MRLFRLLCLLAPPLLAPLPAWSHAILMAGSPAPAAAVAPGPLAIELRYNSRIDAARSLLELRQPGKPPEALPHQAPRADVLTATATLAPGSYTLRWQVLAVDGHITRGDIPFTVRAP